ncbi:MAG: ABC transporter ATP-binding protein [Minisyncoccota bacterium]
MPKTKEKKDMHVSLVLRAYTAASVRYPWMLALSILGVFGVQATAIIAPLYLKQFIDILSSGIASPATISTLFGILIAYALVLVSSRAADYIQSVATMRIESRVMADLTDTAFSNLIRHGHEFFSSNFSGSLTRQVTRYARAYEQVLDSLLSSFLPTSLFAAGSIAILYARNAWLGIALLAWVVLFVTIQVFLSRWQSPLRAARVEEDSRMTGAISDSVVNQSTVALFAAEIHEETYLGSITKAWRAATLRSWLAHAFIQGVQQALAVLVEVGLLAGAVFLWQKGILTIGDFVLIQVYVLGLINQVWNLGNTLRHLNDAFADASEMVEIMETPHAIQDAAGAAPLAVTQGDIAFTDVSFSFIQDRPVLDHFSMHINGGEKVALVGSSGAGKSTLTKLLLRLYDPSGGAITIDDQDLRAVTQKSLRSMISFVPQESILFHRTLRDNIRYGKQDATDEEVIEAATRAHCHDFISKLPEGYDTYVGERGVKLSGGERQRVAIARAILKNAPILILDEATSSLDSESEALVQDALAKLVEGKTVIAIAHRLSTIMKMDRIIVMENGVITLSGTHDELLAHESNLYKKLWDIQAGGFISADE